MVLRITVAATASYVVASLIFPGTQPLLAPLTAMLVVQVTPRLAAGQRPGPGPRVVAGVLLAVGFAAVVPLEWWSLGLLIFVSITIGQFLRLRSNLVEVAISAMLVLGVGALGGRVGRLAADRRDAGRRGGGHRGHPALPAQGRAARTPATPSTGWPTRSATCWPGPPTTWPRSWPSATDPTPTARRWLDESRRVTHDIPRIGAALIHAEEGRKLNVRAVGRPDAGSGAASGARGAGALGAGHPGLLRALVDAEHAPTWEDPETAEVVLLGLAQTLREMAAGIDSFGELVHDEAEPGGRRGSVRALREALSGLHEARARLDELLLTGVTPDLLELHVAVLTTVKRLLRELDLDERIRRQIRLRPPRPRRRRPRTGRPAPAAPPGPGSDAETQPLPRIPGDQD